MIFTCARVIPEETRSPLLWKTLRNARLNYDELRTVLVEVEGTLDSRPLTFISSDDPEEPLTPSHLMFGRRILSAPEVTGNRKASVDHTYTVSSEDLPKRRKYLGLLLEHFWRLVTLEGKR